MKRFSLFFLSIMLCAILIAQNNLSTTNTTDWTKLWKSGFYESNGGLNSPTSSPWHWGINIGHSSNNENYRFNGQIAITWAFHLPQPVMSFRTTDSNGEGKWINVLTNVGNQQINDYLFVNKGIAIGTNNIENYKLAVNGKIRAKEILVDSEWADFVFSDDYALPTLKEIENHIKENRSLPGIPTEKEIKESGVSLGEMNVKLLQKIEEQTLYIIELNKQIQELSKRICVLEGNN